MPGIWLCGAFGAFTHRGAWQKAILCKPNRPPICIQGRGFVRCFSSTITTRGSSTQLWPFSSRPTLPKARFSHLRCWCWCWCRCCHSLSDLQTRGVLCVSAASYASSYWPAKQQQDTAMFRVVVRRQARQAQQGPRVSSISFSS